MASQRFSDSEKSCLQELIVKHHLLKGIITNPHIKKIKWVQLTEEFNSIETNSKRTENQLRKLRDNLNTRGKITLENSDLIAPGESYIANDEDIETSILKNLNMIPSKHFSKAEKLHLQELVVKHNLHHKAKETKNKKKVRWQRLTEEFNSMHTHSTKTETQLRKCWENLKTRRQTIVENEKLGRTSDEGNVPEEPENQETETIFLPGTIKEENIFTELSVLDSDNDMRSTEEVDTDTEISEPLQFYTNDETEQVHSVTIRQTSGRKNETLNKERRPSIEDEFSVQDKKGLVRLEREAQIHELVMTEKKWLAKAAEETYKKAKIEREAAEELLLLNRAKRLLAESQLNDIDNISHREPVENEESLPVQK